MCTNQLLAFVNSSKVSSILTLRLKDSLFLSNFIGDGRRGRRVSQQESWATNVLLLSP